MLHRVMVQTSARLLALLSLLQVRREWTGRELADRLQVGPRTIRRDVDKLRSLGYPIEAAPGVAGGYRLSAGGELPPLLLDDAEAVAVAVGLRTAAAGSIAGIEETSIRALAKLEQVLPSRLRRRVSALGDATSAFGVDGPRIDADALATIAAACRDGHQLHFGYVAKDDAVTRRNTEPAAVVYSGYRWYLVAFDLDRDDWRTFRIDRISGRLRTGGRGRRRTVPGGDPSAFLKQRLGAAAAGDRPAEPGTIRLGIAAAEARRRIPGRYVTVQEDGSDACLVTTRGRLVAELPRVDGDARSADGDRRPRGARRRRPGARDPARGGGLAAESRGRLRQAGRRRRTGARRGGRRNSADPGRPGVLGRAPQRSLDHGIRDRGRERVAVEPRRGGTRREHPQVGDVRAGPELDPNASRANAIPAPSASAQVAARIALSPSVGHGSGQTNRGRP